MIPETQAEIAITAEAVRLGWRVEWRGPIADRWFMVARGRLRIRLQLTGLRLRVIALDGDGEAATIAAQIGALASAVDIALSRGGGVSQDIVGRETFEMIGDGSAGYVRGAR